MTAETEITESIGHANTIFSALTNGLDLTLPVVDLTAAEYQPPSQTDNPLYVAPAGLKTSDLTTSALDGAGVFDELMKALNAHFEDQFVKGRITGADYAQAYIGATQGALSTAVQFLLGRDQAYWNAQLAQMQARVTEAEAVNAALRIAQTQADVVNAQSQALTSQTQYALTKMKLTTEAVAIEQGEAQVTQIKYQTLSLMPEQLNSLLADNSIKAYQLSAVLPKQVETSSAEISRLTAQTDQTLYETTNILVAQHAGLNKDNAIKDYQLSDVLTAQVAGVIEDTQSKAYQRTFLLPAQLDNLNEQIEGNRAKTLDTRRDGTTVTGSVGVQKDLQNEQITSYKRDAETKMVKLVIDTWMLQRSTDETLPPPTSINDSALNALIGGLRTNLEI